MNPRCANTPDGMICPGPVIGESAVRRGLSGVARRLTFLLALLAFPVVGQTLCPPFIYWQQSYGNENDDVLTAAEETTDGGFLLGGYGWTSNSVVDFRVVRLDAAGHQIWGRTYGGSNFDYLRALRSTTNGGFVLAGYSASSDKGSPIFGHYDGWIVQADNNGNVVWQRSFGGAFFDGFMDVETLSDGGYILGGHTLSQPGTGNKTSPAFGDYDFWVIRVDGQGEKVWEQSFGGSNADYLYDVQPMPDGGFALVGASRSDATGNKSATNNGDFDLWVVRLDAAGNKMWDRDFGGLLYDEGREAIVTADGGLLIGGQSHSPPSGTKQSEHFGAGDYWLVRLDSAGTKLWERTFGGTSGDTVQGLRQTPDGNVIVAGESSSLPGPGKRSPHYGLNDYWILLLNAGGTLLWEQSIGGTGSDVPRMANQTRDGAFFAAGSSASPPSGFKTAPHYGNNDFWLLKFLPQKPNDCDADGVVDSRDLCPGSLLGTIVDARGCTVEQFCPCASDWRNHDDYVHCVRQITGEMVRLGRMTDAERDARLQQALATNCPPTPVPTNPPPNAPISFGFTNFPLGNAVLSQDISISDGSPASSGDWYYGAAVFASGLGEEGDDGMAFLLGQAQSGMFVYPYAPVGWGSFDPANFMLGKAFGRVNGRDNFFIGALQARKTDYEHYPVDVDLSGLAPSSLTFQVYEKTVLRAQRTVQGASGGLAINSGQTMSPRANPFWRMPDGSVGAVIDIASETTVVLPDASTAQGDRVFIRANNPNDVAYVSRFEVYAGGGLPYFGIVDGRLGMFGLVHGIIGASVYNAFEGRLQITSLRHDGAVADSHGVFVELNQSLLYDLSLEPVALSRNQVMQLFVVGEQPPASPTNSVLQTFSALRLYHTGAHLELSASATVSEESWPPVSNTLVRVYRHGSIAGQTLIQGSTLGAVNLKPNGASPRVAGWNTLALGSNGMTITISFDHFVTFVPQASPPLRGNLIQITPLDGLPVTGFRTASLITTTPAFTIKDEAVSVVPPPLDITTTATNVLLSWPLVNEPFALESADSLLGPFSPTAEESVIDNNGSAVSLRLNPESTRFFRLRLTK